MAALPSDLEMLLRVQDFLFQEAALLDDRQNRAWLDLLAEDIFYRAPTRDTLYGVERDAEFSDAHGMHYLNETKATLTTRVAKLESNTAWAEAPPSRTRRFITNVRVTAQENDALHVTSYFHVYKSRLEATEDLYIGERRDVLRRVGTTFEIARRLILFDQTVLLVKNISIFL